MVLVLISELGLVDVGKSISHFVFKERFRKAMNLLLYYFKILKFGTCSLSINFIDTQVARRGRQYHSQPSSTKKKKVEVL